MSEPMTRAEFDGEMAERDYREGKRTAEWEARLDGWDRRMVAWDGILEGLNGGMTALAATLAKLRDSQSELAKATELIDRDLAALIRQHVEHADDNTRHI